MHACMHTHKRRRRGNRGWKRKKRRGGKNEEKNERRNELVYSSVLRLLLLQFSGSTSSCKQVQECQIPQAVQECACGGVPHWLWVVCVVEDDPMNVNVCIVEEETLLVVNCVCCQGRPIEHELCLLWRLTYWLWVVYTCIMEEDTLLTELCVLLRETHWVWAVYYEDIPHWLWVVCLVEGDPLSVSVYYGGRLTPLTVSCAYMCYGRRYPTDCELCVLLRETHWVWTVFIM